MGLVNTPTHFNPPQQRLWESLLEAASRTAFSSVVEEHKMKPEEGDSCKRVVALWEAFLKRAEEEKERRVKAEGRVEELKGGLKEAMELFREREESFDSLARINKEQERKVRR